MPKRGIISAILTAIGVWLLVNFKTPSEQGLSAFSRQTAANPASTDGGSAASPSDGPSPTAAATPSVTTVTGPAISYFFGTAQVKVTVANGKITDVTAVQLPEEGRSGWISSQVEPMLRNEVLAAQSARINLISGATFTSEAYAESLQAALDKAHA
jgi:uncharacterized protein with FMN-binding domain